MPAVGERRQINGQWAEWDGKGWLPSKPPAQGILSSLQAIASPGGLQGIKQYAGELLSGEGQRGPWPTARQEIGAYGLKELKGGLRTLNPINQVKGAANLVLHPIDSVKGAGQQLYDAATGDPEALGGVLGTVVAPKLDAAALRGINTGATKLAESQTARSGVGYGGGYLAAKAAGQPGFAGAILGRMASPLLEAPAREIANGSGWLIDKLGIGNKPAPGSLTAAEKASLAKQGYSPDVIAKIEQASQRYTTGKTVQPEANTLAIGRSLGVPITTSAQALRDAIMQKIQDESGGLK